MLSSVVLNHVPVINFDFRTKCIFICHVIRRVLMTHRDRTQLDDKDYYGNKRLELAGGVGAGGWGEDEGRGFGVGRWVLRSGFPCGSACCSSCRCSLRTSSSGSTRSSSKCSPV